jgi:hypothetical protein
LFGETNKKAREEDRSSGKTARAVIFAKYNILMTEIKRRRRRRR